MSDVKYSLIGLSRAKWKIKVIDYNSHTEAYLFSSVAKRSYYVTDKVFRVYDTDRSNPLLEAPSPINHGLINCVVLLPKLYKILAIIDNKYACLIDDCGFVLSKHKLPLSAVWSVAAYGKSKVVISNNDCRVGSRRRSNNFLVIDCNDDGIKFDVVDIQKEWQEYTFAGEVLLFDRYVMCVFYPYYHFCLVDVRTGKVYESPVRWIGPTSYRLYAVGNSIYLLCDGGLIDLKVFHATDLRMFIDRFTSLPVSNDDQLVDIIGIYDRYAVLACRTSSSDDIDKILAVNLDRIDCVPVANIRTDDLAKVDLIRDIDDIGNCCIVTERYCHKNDTRHLTFTCIDWRSRISKWFKTD